jgi:hypothetical protein
MDPSLAWETLRYSGFHSDFLILTDILYLIPPGGRSEVRYLFRFLPVGWNIPAYTVLGPASEQAISEEKKPSAMNVSVIERI